MLPPALLPRHPPTAAHEGQREIGSCGYIVKRSAPWSFRTGGCMAAAQPITTLVMTAAILRPCATPSQCWKVEQGVQEFTRVA